MLSWTRFLLFPLLLTPTAGAADCLFSQYNPYANPGQGQSDPMRMPFAPMREALDRLRKDSLKDMECVDLRPGDSKVISWETALSPTTVKHHYRLSRISEKEFVAEINPQFTRAPDYDGPARTDEELNQKMRARVSECLSRVNGLLRGPDEQMLAVKVSSPPDLPAFAIRVGGKGDRDNSESYSSDATCPVITHEVMHQLGLVDEYQERKIQLIVDPVTGAQSYIPDGNGNAFACRSLGPADSVMVDPMNAIADARDFDQYEFRGCTCNDRTGASCGKIELAGKETCPEGTHPISRYAYYSKGQPASPAPSGENFALFAAEPRKIGFMAKKRDSMLYPAQFRSITRPGCARENEKYYECSSGAYRSPIGMMMMGGCPVVPDYCHDSKAPWLE